jgi:trk system potassium uptake protein TrkH
MRLRGVPVLMAFLFALGALMLVPAGHAALERDWRTARLFFYAGAFAMSAAAILGAAARKRLEDDAHARAELLTLLGAFSAAPVLAAAPIWLVAPELRWSGAYFEAVSCLTTTGASLLDLPETYPPALHLWRALLGWVGGLATLTAAVAILAPRELLDLRSGRGARAPCGRCGRWRRSMPG